MNKKIKFYRITLIATWLLANDLCIGCLLNRLRSMYTKLSYLTDKCFLCDIGGAFIYDRIVLTVFSCSSLHYSEHNEGLSWISFNMFLFNSDDIESDCFWDWSALTNSNDISNSGSFITWGKMSWDVVMSLFESIVFLDVVQIISSDNNGSVHLCWENDTFEDSSSNGNVWGEWTLLVNISALDSCGWGFETYKR